MTTFKQFLIEGAAGAALKIVKSFIGPSAKKVIDFDDSLLDSAKEEQKEFVKTSIGQWIITVFKTREGPVAQVAAPRGANQPIQYFVQEA